MSKKKIIGIGITVVVAVIVVVSALIIRNSNKVLTVEELLQKPENCEYSRFELILGQIRHQFWHIGLSSAITFESKHIWNEFTGLNGLRSKI